MVVICPKCKTKLKIDENKLSPEGSRFKCPKCATVLSVKKPASAPAAPAQKPSINANKILVAHANPDVLKTSASILSKEGFQVITASDGIDAMVKALKDFPFLAILDVGLPKIYGFEVCKKIKSRPDTKEMKVILLASVYDKNKYKREPNSLYGADDYLDEPNLAIDLVEKIARLRSPHPEESAQKSAPEPAAPSQPSAPTAAAPSPRQDTPAAPPAQPSTLPKPPQATGDEMVEKARRLARLILEDIKLYNPGKVDAAVKADNFQTVFAADLKEGLKVYESKIPQATRNTGDYFKEALDNFISARKKALA